MREVQAKPFVINENPDFSQCRQKVEARNGYYSEILEFMKDSSQYNKNLGKVTQKDNKVRLDTNASPRDLNETAFEAVTPSQTPSKEQDTNATHESKVNTRRNSNFINALIY